MTQEGTTLKPGHIQGTVCRAVAPIMARVGDKWSMLIVMELGDGALRFNQIKRVVDGISQRMLTLSLRGLERDGLVRRTVFATVPPRVEYALTELGRSLQQPIKALGDWAQKHQAAIAAAQNDFDSQISGADHFPKSAGEPIGSGRAT